MCWYSNGFYRMRCTNYLAPPACRKDLLEGDFGSDAQAIATALKRDLDQKWQPCW